MAKKKAEAKMTLKERLKAKITQLKEGGGNRDIIFIKADTTVRARILNVGEENEWYVEVIQFYLPGVKGVFSPSTTGDFSSSITGVSTSSWTIGTFFSSSIVLLFHFRHLSSQNICITTFDDISCGWV